MSNRVLVTGGAGFIGTHLCRKLTEQKYQVRVLDLRDPPSSVAGVEYIKGDIKHDGDVSGALAGVQAVFHFAADSGVELCERDPVATYANNVGGTVQVLDCIARIQERTGQNIRFIFSGSAVVYGRLGKENEPLLEASPLPTPISFYGAQKLASEQAIAIFSAKHKIHATCFRFFNVYGPGQDPRSPYSGVISIFSDRVSRKVPLYLNGGGKQTRDFVSVHDIVDACHLALKTPTSADTQPINLGSGKITRISDLAATIGRISKLEPRLESRGDRAGDIQHSLASIERAKQILGWEPKVTLEAGLFELF